MTTEPRWHVIRFTELDSTSDEALRHLRQHGAGGAWTAIVADGQTGGRGRRGRTWLAVPGRSLCFSLILAPPLAIETFCRLSIVTGVLAADTLASMGVAVQLKWPNDLIMNGRKIGGILAECVQTPVQPCVVIGIGVNVSARYEDFPGEMAGTAGSILTESGLLVDGNVLLHRFLDILRDGYERFFRQDGDLSGFREQWERSCFGRNRETMVTTARGRERGIIRGLRDDGALIVEIGRVATVVYGGDVL